MYGELWKIDADIRIHPGLKNADIIHFQRITSANTGSPCSHIVQVCSWIITCTDSGTLQLVGHSWFQRAATAFQPVFSQFQIAAYETDTTRRLAAGLPNSYKCRYSVCLYRKPAWHERGEYPMSNLQEDVDRKSRLSNSQQCLGRKPM